LLYDTELIHISHKIHNMILVYILHIILYQQCKKFTQVLSNYKIFIQYMHVYHIICLDTERTVYIFFFIKSLGHWKVYNFGFEFLFGEQKPSL